MNVERKKVILNCDPGTDDSICIIMAMTHPEVELLAITAESGNFTADISSQHALQVLEYMGRKDIPVAQGMRHPLVRTHPSDPYCHGEDGLGNHFFPAPDQTIIDKHAALVIIDEVMRYPGEVSVVCTAPLTNVALAMMLKPEIIPNIKQIIHLGGSYGVTDFAFTNATGDNPMSEWNVYVDPEAAKIVYESGVNLITIGLDIAFNPGAVNITEQTIQKLKELDTKEARYTLEIIDYIDRNNSIPKEGIFINGPIDTTAMCAFLHPEILKLKEIHVAVDTGSQLTRGMTIWDRRDHFRWEHLPKIKTAYEIDGEKYQDAFYEAISGKVE